MSRIIVTDGLICEIDSECGATCRRLFHKSSGIEILRCAKTEAERNSYLFGMPVLFPPNRIDGGKFEFDGKIYSFPINEVETNCSLHGMLNYKEFETVKESENSIICRYKADKEEKYMNFPHEFEFIVKYLVNSDTLIQRVSITNKSNEKMPVLLGFHTDFDLTSMSQYKGKIKIKVGYDKVYYRNERYLPTGRILDFDDDDKKLTKGLYVPKESGISKLCQVGRDGKIEFRIEQANLKITYKCDKKFIYRMIYSADTLKYFCVEPLNVITNYSNILQKKELSGFDYLMPGETTRYESKIQVENLN